MDRRPLSAPQLASHLERQLRHLRNSSALFDAGDLDEAVRLGTTVRILMHESRTSHSLLGQLGLRSILSYVDTCIYRDDVERQQAELIERTYGPNSGVRIVASTPAEVGFVMFTGDPATELAWAPVLDTREVRFSPLDIWWSKPAIETSTGKTFARKQLVGFMANQDGGAHVDPRVDATYDDFTQDALGVGFFYRAVSDDEFDRLRPPDAHAPAGNVAAASMRQIAWELEQTLLRHLAG